MEGKNMYLTIDIGNTLQKAGVFSDDAELVENIAKTELDESDIADLCEKHLIKYSIISSVGARNVDVEAYLNRNTTLLPFSHETPLPIRIDYDEPQTLGLDRIADAVAAHTTFPDKNVLSIQAGTCLVMDFVTKDGVFKGGSISPGLDMRFAALHHYTQRLPLVKKREIDFHIGHSTRQSIESGVINGIADEINGAISRYKQQFGEIQIVLTGGNKNDLEKSIKNTIFAPSNFILYGLCKVLIFNVEKGRI